jgi:hypothetical protein
VATVVQKETPEDVIESKHGPAPKPERKVVMFTLTFEQIKKLFKRIKERLK